MRRNCDVLESRYYDNGSMSVLQREPFPQYANQLHFPHWEREKHCVMKRIL
jgi:hypothetical protein